MRERSLLLLFIAVCFSCQMNMENKSERPVSLAGTKWKLAGIVETQKSDLKVLEPIECEQCYIIYFDSDCTIVGFTTSNEIIGTYKINFEEKSIIFISFGGTKVGELGDGKLWWDIFPTIKSFFLKKNELRLYYNNQKNYLLFNQIEL